LALKNSPDATKTKANQTKCILRVGSGKGWSDVSLGYYLPQEKKKRCEVSPLPTEKEVGEKNVARLNTLLTGLTVPDLRFQGKRTKDEKSLKR